MFEATCFGGGNITNRETDKGRRDLWESKWTEWVWGNARM